MKELKRMTEDNVRPSYALYCLLPLTFTMLGAARSQPR